MCRNDVHLIQKVARSAFCDSNSIVTPHLRRKTVTIRKNFVHRSTICRSRDMTVQKRFSSPRR